MEMDPVEGRVEPISSPVADEAAEEEVDQREEAAFLLESEFFTMMGPRRCPSIKSRPVI